MHRILKLTSLSLLPALLLVCTSAFRLAASDSATGSAHVLTDFTSSSANFGWYVVNDNVMGGRSTGGFEIAEGTFRFAGRTNTDGGGFSSIRTKRLKLDLSRYTGIRVRVKGDGRRYTWRLTTDARWRGQLVSYWADFDTQKGTWTAVDIPFSSFVPKFRGYEVDAPVLDPGEISGMGLMIYDNRDGPFELHLAGVEAYSTEAPFSLSHYRWKNRVLVIGAPAEDDESLRQQQERIELTREAFVDRDMVLVTLLASGVSTAGERALTASEAAATRAAVKMPSESFALTLLGKDGTVKLSTETVVEMIEIYKLIDSMPMRQREMSVP